MELQDLKNKYSSCKKCVNCNNTDKVFGCGPKGAKIAVVGESPDISTAAKEMLDKILTNVVETDIKNVYFTNAILCRPNGKNRSPVKQEVDNCKNRLFEELTIIKPRYTLLVGNTALNAVMTGGLKINDSHGKWFTHLAEPCFYYFALLHPSWILLSSTEDELKGKKMKMWVDAKKFKQDITFFDGIYNKSKG